MSVPGVIPIACEPNNRTATIGHYMTGQFLASITYAFPAEYRLGDDWKEHKRLYVVLHRFDVDGHHLESDIWRAGTLADHDDVSPTERAQERLSKLIEGLPGARFTDIAIRPFQLTVDDVVFGLITERHASGDGEDDWAELYPDGLGFAEPWDGLYDT